MGEWLAHHGVKGQKWGIRRYQNEDGSLTEAGKERYGNMYNHGEYERQNGSDTSKIVRKVAGGIVREWAGEERKKILRAKIEENKSRIAGDGPDSNNEKLNKKVEKRDAKLNKKLNAQLAAEDNLKAYKDHTSTGKMIAQDLLFAPFAATNYRNARARGSGRVRALLETNAGILPISTILAAIGNKKAYGSRIVMSGI